MTIMMRVGSLQRKYMCNANVETTLKQGYHEYVTKRKVRRQQQLDYGASGEAFPTFRKLACPD